MTQYKKMVVIPVEWTQSPTPVVHSMSRRSTAMKKTVEKKIKYMCKCRKVYFDKQQFKNHKKLHRTRYVRVEGYECDVCKEVLRTKRGITFHMRDLHRPQKCLLCCITVDSKMSLRLHMKVHREERDFTCPVCSKPFKNQGVVNRHMNHFHVPDFTLVVPDTMKTESVEYSCDDCDFTTNLRSRLVPHMQRFHNGSLNHSCLECGRAFFSKHGLAGHMELHDGMQYVCSKCGQCFKRQAYLTNHEKRVHEPCTKRQCHVCGKAFASRSAFKCHMDKHFNKDKHQCKICGKTVGSRDTLLVHLRIHTGEKPYLCVLCGKTFSSRTYWRSHQKVHTGEKNHHCTQCDKSFAQRSSLTLHLKYHSGLKPFECELCDKAFITKPLLAAHEKTHAS